MVKTKRKPKAIASPRKGDEKYPNPKTGTEYSIREASLDRAADAMVARANDIVAALDRLCPLLNRKCIGEECAWYRKSRKMCGAIER